MNSAIILLFFYAGTSPKPFNVLVDTGSSNFAIAAYDNPNTTKYFHYKESSSYVDSNQKIELNYTQGHWSGTLGKHFTTIRSHDTMSTII